MLGGIMMARVPATVTTPAATDSVYPWRFISGTVTAAMVAAEAVLEPLMAATPAEARIEAMASPPGNRSSQRRAAANTSSTMPPAAMNWAMRMNMGTVVRV